MAKIIGIHGIGHQFQGENVIHSHWLPALKDGLLQAGVSNFDPTDLCCAFYGDLFRTRPGLAKGLGEPLYDATDITDPWEQEFLILLWQEAALIDPAVPDPDAMTKGLGGGRTPRMIQRALDAVTHSKFFADLAERAFIANLKQVRAYLNESAVRAQVQERIAAAVSTDTRIIIGHSLGSIVAYEAVANHPEWQISTLITLGSPLGIRNLIFDKLSPAPKHEVGIWPASVKQWFNIADGGDVVALVKQLSTRFGAEVQDSLIYNGATAHSIEPYLTAVETGYAIASGLST